MSGSNAPFQDDQKIVNLWARVYESKNFRMQEFEHVFSQALFDNERV